MQLITTLDASEKYDHSETEQFNQTADDSTYNILLGINTKNRGIPLMLFLPLLIP